MDDTASTSSGTFLPIRRRFNFMFRIFSLLAILFPIAFFLGCVKDDNLVTTNETDTASGIASMATGKIKAVYEQTNLVSDVAEYNPVIIDTNLVNAWGIAISPGGVFWISAADKHLSVVYNDEGETLRPPVMMDGYPTGQVFNGTTGFVIPDVGPARFIFVTEDGKITAWRTGNTAPTIIDDSGEGASYTGAELAMNNGEALLYVANVAEGSIDVYDSEWNEIEGLEFEDPLLPSDASPFNIQLVFGKLYVTYTQPGGGVVNIFNTNGEFVERFATGGTLNEPWGITNTPPEFGLGQAVLIGNFGDGRINVYNKNGLFKGQLGDEDRNPITIEGLWALEFTAGAFAGSSEADLYFTAGPDNEEHGIFGEIEFAGDEEQ